MSRDIEVFTQEDLGFEPIHPKRTVCAIVCPKCQGLVIDLYPHPQEADGAIAFVCKKCKIIIEPPCGIRATCVYTSLEEFDGTHI